VLQGILESCSEAQLIRRRLANTRTQSSEVNGVVVIDAGHAQRYPLDRSPEAIVWGRLREAMNCSIITVLNGHQQAKTTEMLRTVSIELLRKIMGLWNRSRKPRRACLVYVNNHLVSRFLSRRLRMLWYRKVMGYVLGSESSILPDFRVSRLANITIGCHTVINNSCRFDNRRKIVIGDNVSVSYGTTILTLGHDIDSPDFVTKGGDVVVEDYVWLCANCMIMPGVRMKKGSVALAGSVVTSDVEAFDVVGGNPAKVIRKRSQDLRYKLKWNPRVSLMLG
jgi:acetyltransferase-like isoleucine patch superfamily enzyme